MLGSDQGGRSSESRKPDGYREGNMEKTGGASTWWKNFVFNALLYLEPVRRHRCSSFNHFYTSRYGGLGSFKVTEIGTDLPYKSRCVVLLVCELQQPNSHFPPFPRHCDKKFRNHSFYAVFYPPSSRYRYSLSSPVNFRKIWFNIEKVPGLPDTTRYIVYLCSKKLACSHFSPPHETIKQKK